MRLIDADKLMERAKMHSVKISTGPGHYDYGMTLGTLNKTVKECEVDAVPVVRGKWILQSDKSKVLYGWYSCSECGATIGGKCNFCSECGADMREVDE